MKISIVFDESDTTGVNVHGGGKRFFVYLDGITPERAKEIDAMTPDEQLEKLSTAEFWALRCFQITMAAIQGSGAVDLYETRPRRKGST